MQCTGTIHVTLLLLFFELLPFVNFHFKFLSGSLLPDYKSYQLETSQTDRTHYGEVQCTRTITLLLIFFLSYCLSLILSLIFFLDHNFQNIKAINSKLDTLIELIIEKYSVQEPQICYLYLFDYCPLLNFILNICLDRNFQTIKAINLKLHTLIEHMMENSTAVPRNHNSDSLLYLVVLCYFLLGNLNFKFLSEISTFEFIQR